jgi:hypothetical protein
MTLDPRSEALSARPASATFSSSADSISIELDNLLYRTDEEKCFCACSIGWGSSGWLFPRHLVSVHGVIVEVEELDNLAMDGNSGLQKSICISSSVEKLGKGSVIECKSLSTVTFEYGSRLSSIDESAFSGCSSLSSICIPSSVEKLGRQCFSYCESLSTVTFESGSILSSIEESGFSYCSSLSSICIPPALQELGECAFDRANLQEISVAEGNLHSEVCGD